MHTYASFVAIVVACSMAPTITAQSAHRYAIVEGAFTWQEAKADAESRGGHLATITSETEFQFLKQNNLLRNALWIGATDSRVEGVWEWVTGEAWNYTRWNSGEPNGDQPDNPPGDHSSYAELVADGTVWNDAPSSFKLSYLLELEDSFDLRIEHAVNLTFKSEVGKFYEIQASPQVSPPTWTGVGKILIGDGGRVDAGFVTKQPSATIYRVHELSLDDGLVSFYPFNGTAEDQVSPAQNGTVFGATGARDRFNRVNGCYEFNGVDDYVLIPESSAFDSTDYTVSCWFLPLRQPVEADFLISKGQNNFEIHTGSAATGPGGMRFLPRVASGNHWDVAAGLYKTNDWNHIVAIYRPSSNNVRVFLNGVLAPIAGPATVQALPDNSLPVRIGMRSDGTLPFKGRIDSVRIYNRGLADDEAQALYRLEE